MKVKKQIRKLKKLLHAETREQKAKRDDLKRLLHKMKSKENSLNEKLNHESDDETRRRLKKKIDMLHAQRKKGILTLRNIDENNNTVNQ